MARTKRVEPVTRTVEAGHCPLKQIKQVSDPLRQKIIGIRFSGTHLLEPLQQVTKWVKRLTSDSLLAALRWRWTGPFDLVVGSDVVFALRFVELRRPDFFFFWIEGGVAAAQTPEANLEDLKA